MYVDGFILPMRDDNLAAYTALAEKFAARARAFGALGSVESIGDGLEHGHTTDFFRAVNAEDGENVVFSFVLWPDRATRDAGWSKLMNDPEVQPDAGPMPFDGRRMFWGGFRPIVEALALRDDADARGGR